MKQSDRIARLKRFGIPLYPAGSRRTHTIQSALSSSDDAEQITVAGRIVFLDAKTRQCRLTDNSGTLDFILPVCLASELAALLQELIPGDIVECTLHRTQGVLRLTGARLLTPALIPEPESIPDTALSLKADILKATSRFFEERGYLCVTTPNFMTVPDLTPGITSFKTTFHDQAGRTVDYYLQTSPEHYMKRLLVMGHENIFQICRFFRDGERFDTHHPEFLGLEWYQAYTDYVGVMETTEGLITSISEAVTGSRTISYQGNTIDLNPPWPRETVRGMVHGRTGIDLDTCPDEDTFRSRIDRLGIDTTGAESTEDLFHRLFTAKVVPFLPKDRPVIVKEYPSYLPSLARPLDGNPLYVERFELYIGGLELANAFTELNDPIEQRTRYEMQIEDEARRGYGGGLDEAFLLSLERGMPPAGGIALGLDRLAMLFADSTQIDDVIAFRNN